MSEMTFSNTLTDDSENCAYDENIDNNMSEC